MTDEAFEEIMRDADSVDPAELRRPSTGGLVSCPFCGNDLIGGFALKSGRVECGVCKARGPRGKSDDAVDKWNARR